MLQKGDQAEGLKICDSRLESFQYKDQKDRNEPTRCRTGITWGLIRDDIRTKLALIHKPSMILIFLLESQGGIDWVAISCRPWDALCEALRPLH